MVLESTMIIVDNGSYMRNGDYIPSRLDAQASAVSLVCQSKRQSHPENAIGLMTSSNPSVKSALSIDVSKIYSKLSNIHPNADTQIMSKSAMLDSSNINISTAIKIAHLVLRNRLNKNHKMRIVAFVGSVIYDDEKELEKLGKRLKKEKVSIDVVSFGELDANRNKLTALINAANSTTGSSHLVSVPPGISLRDSLLSSPMIVGEDGRGAVQLGNMDFGLDPNEDPELLLALRVSLEDQRHRQEATRQLQTTESDDLANRQPINFTEDENMLQRLMMRDGSNISTNVTGEETMDINSMTEEEQIAYALAMSLQQEADTSETQQSDEAGKMDIEPKE